MMRRSAWDPVNTDMSIGTAAVYGLLSLTPKFLSPLSSSRMKTPAARRLSLSSLPNIPVLTCVHQPSFRLVHPGVIDVVEDGDDDLQHVAAFQNVVEELSVVFAQLPEQY